MRDKFIIQHEIDVLKGSVEREQGEIARLEQELKDVTETVVVPRRLLEASWRIQGAMGESRFRTATQSSGSTTRDLSDLGFSNPHDTYAVYVQIARLLGGKGY